MDASNPPSLSAGPARPAWNKGKLPGPKPPLRLGHVWSIRAGLQLERSTRDLALFNLAIDSKLRGCCDLVALRVDDVAPQRLRSRSSHRPSEENRSARSTTRQYARLVSHPCLGTVGHGTLSPLRGVGRAWQLCSGISDSLGAAQPNWLVSQERGGQPWMNAAPHRDS
jgi:hypothetical protein